MIHEIVITPTAGAMIERISDGRVREKVSDLEHALACSLTNKLKHVPPTQKLGESGPSSSASRPVPQNHHTRSYVRDRIIAVAESNTD